jgi:GT2 family glycosyltransferase
MTENPKRKDLSIIIVCYKGLERISGCLRELGAFKETQFTYEVIVVDNDPDGEVSKNFRAFYPEFRFIQNKINGGFGNGCNLGSGEASGDFFLFLNPDTVPVQSEIEKLFTAAGTSSRYHIVSCRQIRKNGNESMASGAFPDVLSLTGILRAVFRKRSGAKTGKDKNMNGDVIFPDWVSGSVMMVRRSVFQRLKGFDEDFWMYYEDVDLCKRLRDSGGEVVLFKSITIEHNHGGSSRINPGTTALTKSEVHISQHVYISKHMKGIKCFLIQSFLVLNNLVSGLFPATSGLLVFFYPRLFAYTLKYSILLRYYQGALLHKSWISPRSVGSRHSH